MWKCCAEWLYYYLGYITNSSVGVCPGTPLKRFVTPKPPFICKYENSFRTISASDPVYRFLLNGEAKFFLRELIYLSKLRMHLINFARIISHFSEKKRSWNQFKNVSVSRPRRPRPVRGERPPVQPVLTTSLYRDKRPMQQNRTMTCLQFRFSSSSFVARRFPPIQNSPSCCHNPETLNLVLGGWIYQ
jgi:hypothetical protein